MINSLIISEADGRLLKLYNDFPRIGSIEIFIAGSPLNENLPNISILKNLPTRPLLGRGIANS
jgi:hypothetical protein